MLNCVIIDDEQFAIDALLKYIDLMPGLRVSGIYTDSLQALQSVSSTDNIDILFMDIDMPSLSGLELASVLRAKTRKLIFTTAHSRYAFEAYEVAGDAFLLKPYSFAKFSTTINRLFAGMEQSAQAVQERDDYFLVKSKADDLAIIRIRYDEVIAFESAQNYIRIHLSGQRILTAYLTLKDILQLTAGRSEFKQFHRAFIISTWNISQIRGNTVQMINNLSFSVGDLYKKQFTAYLEDKLLTTSRK